MLQIDYEDTDAVVEDIRLFHTTIEPRDRTYQSVAGLVRAYAEEINLAEGVVLDGDRRWQLIKAYTAKYGTEMK